MNGLSQAANPWTVTAPGGVTRLLVMNRNEPFPMSFAVIATTATDKVALRISGGCKGMGPNDKAEMLEYFDAAFEGFAGMIWSGGTRQSGKDGGIDPMVTDLPGVIAAGNPGCVALGSTPRTDYLRLVGESRLVLDEYGTGLNPAMGAILLVQSDANSTLDWNGDLDQAFRLMTSLRNDGKFRVGWIGWNGGAVTEEELIRSAALRWPTFLIRGSKRVTDELIEKVENNDAALIEKVGANHGFVIADRRDPFTLRTALLEHGFLKA